MADAHLPTGRPTRRFALLLGVIAALAAACGGGGSGASASATVQASRADGMGKVLTDKDGKTLYMFEKDSGSSSSCSGACAAAWPPLLTEGDPQAGSGATAGKLGTTKRDNGDLQVTYAGHPLYYYAKDKKAGDVNGQDVDAFGAAWYVLAPSGSVVEKKPGGSKGGSGGGGGGGGYGGY